MTDGPRVRRLVVFQHGVAYVERGGPADGPFEIAFRRGDMPDVVSSLAVWVASGNARVGAVTFATPPGADQPIDRDLDQQVDRDLHARWPGGAGGAGGALRGVLEALRGRGARGGGGGGGGGGAGAARVEEVEGLVVGLTGDEGGGASVVLRASDGAFVGVALAAIERVEAIDAAGRAALDALVERAREGAGGGGRRVRVALAGRADDLRVACVVPAAPWQLAYRLVRQRDATLLMGWGVVHNPVDEAIDDVEVSLSSGQPVSFVVDLYRPHEVERAMVDVANRSVTSPAVAGDEGASAARGARGGWPRVAATLADDDDRGRGGMGTMIALAASEAAGAAGVGGREGAARGPREPVTYRATQRVSLGRGGSALVPVVAAAVQTRVERVHREAEGEHPSLVLAFDNGTLTPLVEGPAVIFDAEGSFVGEALLPYTPRAAEARLAYARDEAVRCRRETRAEAVAIGVRLTPGAIIEELRREEAHTLRVESEHDVEIEVFVELPRAAGRALDPGHAQPVHETPTTRRFKVAAPARGKGEALVVERWADARSLRHEQLTPRELAGWLDGGLIDRGTHDALLGVLQAWARARSLDEQRARVEREQHESAARQQGFSEQLASLGEGADAAQRARLQRDVDRERERCVACEAELLQLRDAGDQARRYASQTLGVLVAHAERLRR